jgi:hypothetical protein
MKKLARIATLSAVLVVGALANTPLPNMYGGMGTTNSGCNTNTQSCPINACTPILGVEDWLAGGFYTLIAALGSIFY